MRLARRVAGGPCAACAAPRSAPLCDACREASLLGDSPLHARLGDNDVAFAGSYHGLAPGAVLSPLGRALRGFKDRGDRHAGRCLCAMFVTTVSPALVGADLVVAVPSDRGRVRVRGFAPAAWFARALAARLGLRVEATALRRRSGLPPQRGLDGAARRVNAARAFTLGPSPVAGYRVVLVDDVATTGATLAACTRLLHERGAARVVCTVLACADEAVIAECRSKTASAGTRSTNARRP